MKSIKFTKTKLGKKFMDVNQRNEMFMSAYIKAIKLF